MARDGYIDSADVRPCRLCGRDVLRVPEGAYHDSGPLYLEPFTVRGSELPMGYTLRRFAVSTFWATHVGSVAPDEYAFPLHICKRDEPAPPPTRGSSMTEGYTDPFAVGERRPAVSFKGAPIGATVTCNVVAAPKTVQSRDFETGELEYWDAAKTQPKMDAVIDVEVNGQPYSVWATVKGSQLFYAIAEAQQKAGSAIAPGGVLTIRFASEKPNEKNPRLNAQKIYEVDYAPGNVFAQPQQSSAQEAVAATSSASASAPPWT